MNDRPLLEDLRLFCTVVRNQSFAASARELGASNAYVSKRIALLEDSLQVRLLHRTTRSVSLTEQGDIVHQWAIDGHGIILRSVWDVGPSLDRGDLVRILADYDQPADVWAVYPSRLSTSAKLRVCVEFLEEWLGRSAQGRGSRAGGL